MREGPTGQTRQRSRPWALGQNQSQTLRNQRGGWLVWGW